MDKNLITVFLYCRGADGTEIYLGQNHLAWCNEGYDVIEVLAELFHKINPALQTVIRIVDADEYLEDKAVENFAEQTKLSEEEVNALLEGDIDKFAVIFNKRGKDDGRSN